VVGADGFRRLTFFKLVSPSPGQVVFHPGAMPKAEIVELHVNLRVAKEEATANGGDCADLGMGNLPSLRKVDVCFDRPSRRQAEYALRNSLRAHPNRPTLHIGF